MPRVTLRTIAARTPDRFDYMNEMTAKYRAMDRLLPDILAQNRNSPVAYKKPWWKLW